MGRTTTRAAALDGQPLRGLPLAEQTLPALLERQAQRYGDKPLLRIGLARAHLRRGRATRPPARPACCRRPASARGDRVALMCENRIELLDLILGAAWIGAIAVPLNTALRGEQLAHQLRNSGARVLAMDTRARRGPRRTSRASTTLEQVWALDGVPPTSPPAGYRRRAARRRRRRSRPAPVGPGDTARDPLHVRHHRARRRASAARTRSSTGGACSSARCSRSARTTSSTRCLPLFHTNALNAFVQALVAGATYELGPRFSASRFWTQVAASGATVTYLLGAMVNILMSRRRRPERPRAHACATALAPGDAGRRCSTASASASACSSSRATARPRPTAPIGESWREQRPGWMGRVRKGFDARVVDDLDARLPDGEPRRAGAAQRPRRSRSRPATSRCRRRPSSPGATCGSTPATASCATRTAGSGSWTASRTRSAAAARTSRPSRSSRRCSSHPAVAVGRGLPGRVGAGRGRGRGGRHPARGRTAEPVELIRHCEPRLAYFAIPRYVHFVEALPLTENGKVRKAVLRDAGVTDDMWDREAAGVTIRRLGR